MKYAINKKVAIFEKLKSKMYPFLKVNYIILYVFIHS